MATKKFQSKEVERQYLKSDKQGIMEVVQHCCVNDYQFASFANDKGTVFEMKRPDLIINGSLSEIIVSHNWLTMVKPTSEKWRHGIMIFMRKAGQARYLKEGQDGYWWIVNGIGTHALILNFKAKPLGEGTYYDRKRGTRDEVVYFDLADAKLIKLDKTNTRLN